MSNLSIQPGSSTQALVIVASHAVLRYALRQLLGETGRFSTILDVESADRAAEIAKSHPNSTFLLVPDVNSIIAPKLIKQLRAQAANARIVVVAIPGKAFEEADLVIAQNYGWDELLAAVTVESHSTATSPSLVKPARRRVVSSDTPAALSTLSIREREVFYLLANGVPNRLIAKQLFVSPRTIETHRARVIRKLGLSSTASIVRFAIRHNLLSA